MDKVAFHKFENIQHTPLRVYNRSVLLFNIMSDFGKDVAKEYLDGFSQEERKQIFLMNTFIKQRGKEAAHKFATEGLELANEVSE